MKIFLPLSIVTSFFLSGISFSQQTLQFTNVTNLDMMIANIFGVQCDGVSNVQLFSSPYSVGRFENGAGIGLNSGLVLSTGIVANSNQFYDAFNSTAIGGIGNADIASYGAANGQTPDNYDACRVEFDFSPSITDTIRFTYILASEEYPEYSMSSFTDRFLFLISENGGPTFNIAVLPGTTTPVEINSVNQFMNPQYYIDNSTAPSATYFVFDGYTTPFEAKFFAQAGSSYHIKLVIADVSDYIYDSAILLDEQESFNDISGNLTVNGAPAEGILEVFNYVMTDTLLAQPVQTLTVSNGSYLADSLQTGMYHVRFTPDPVLFPGVAPLYYTSGDTWTTAEAIGLPCFLNSGNINSNTLSAMSGNGIISGNVIIDTSYLKSPTVGFENALLKLFNSTDDVVAFTYTDVDGNYQFQNVSTGTYSIKMDVPYIPQLNDHSISLTGNQVVLGADFSVLSDGITAVDNIMLGIAEESLSWLTLYPNPASEKVYLNNTSSTPIAYQILSLEGQIIENGFAGVGETSINIEKLSNGIYFVRLGEKDLRKLIIKE